MLQLHDGPMLDVFPEKIESNVDLSNRRRKCLLLLNMGKLELHAEHVTHEPGKHLRI